MYRFPALKFPQEHADMAFPGMFVSLAWAKSSKHIVVLG